MVYYILLERVTVFVGEIDVYIRVVGIYLSAALVYGHEYRLNSRCGLCHYADGTCWSNRETGDVAAAILLHLCVKARTCLFQAVYEWVAGFALYVEYLKSTTLFCKVYR